MYLVDTNVVSEYRRVGAGQGNPNVAKWALAIPNSQQYLSVLTVMELEKGYLLMARRDAAQAERLREWLDKSLFPAAQGRIVEVDVAISKCAAALHVPNPRPDIDALIAATALVHGLTVVTRNVADFAPMGVKLLNPWEPQE
jgi:toxin FitB